MSVRFPLELLRSLALFTIMSLFVLMLARTSVLIGLLDYQSYNFNQISSLLYMGLRFDLKIIATLSLAFYLLPISILLLIFKNHKIILKTFDKILFGIFSLEFFICFIGYGYYSHFGTPIDHLMFGLWEDGFKEVILSMIFNPLVITLILSFFFLTVIFYIIFLNFRSSMNNVYYNLESTLTCLVILSFILLLLARGSVGTFPLSKKTNQENSDPILNSLALNSLMNLYYAYKENNEDIINFSSIEILNKFNFDTFDNLKSSAGYNIKNPLIQTSINNISEEPNVIFILMEGWSTQIALKHSKENNVLGEFNRHKNEDFFLTKFFSNSYGTSPTLERIILNSPLNQLSTSKGKRISYDTSNLIPFKKSGYYTQFISGGNREWRNTGNFYLNQGFDDFFDRTHIKNHTKNTSNNPWGAYEEDLFSFLKHKLTSNRDNKTFSFVLTTNNHPPVVLPNSFKSPSYDYSKYKIPKSEYLKEMLDAYYYASDELGKFMTWLKSSEFSENTIVVATGDHILKGFDNYNSKSKIFAKYSVPFYAYIPKKYKQISNKNITGSHLDIFPTLYDLSLSNYTHYTFGKSLLRKKEKTSFAWHQGPIGLFSSGVVFHNKQYDWLEGSDLLLESEGKNIDSFKIKNMEKAFFQSEVAKFLIFKNFEEKSNRKN